MASFLFNPLLALLGIEIACRAESSLVLGYERADDGVLSGFGVVLPVGLGGKWPGIQARPVDLEDGAC